MSKPAKIFTSGPFTGQLFDKRFVMDEPHIVLIDLFKRREDEKPSRTVVASKSDYMKWAERYLA